MLTLFSSFFSVLNPANTTAQPNPTATSQVPAFSGAMPLADSAVPFASLLPATSSGREGLSTGEKVGLGLGLSLGAVLIIVLVVIFIVPWRYVERRPHARAGDGLPFAKTESIGEFGTAEVESLPMETISGEGGFDAPSNGSVLGGKPD